MQILFTICGRAGTKGCKNKNIRELYGRPIVYYTLAAIRLYEEAHQEHTITIALNTDSDELIRQTKEQDIIQPVRFVPRKEELAGDATPKVEVVRDTYLQCSNEKGDFDVIVDLDITSPLRRLCDIEETLRQAVEDPRCDLAFSVVNARRNPYFNMVEERDGYYKKVCKSNYTARQQAPSIYELNASIYAYRPSFLKSKPKKTILDYNCRIAVMPDYLVLDIDSEEDFGMLELLIPHYIVEDNGIKKMFETLSEAERIK